MEGVLDFLRCVDRVVEDALVLVQVVNLPHLRLAEEEIKDVCILPDPRRGVALGQGHEPALETPADEHLGNTLPVRIRHADEDGILEAFATGEGAIGLYHDPLPPAVRHNVPLLKERVEFDLIHFWLRAPYALQFLEVSDAEIGDADGVYDSLGLDALEGAPHCLSTGRAGGGGVDEEEVGVVEAAATDTGATGLCRGRDTRFVLALVLGSVLLFRVLGRRRRSRLGLDGVENFGGEENVGSRRL